MDAHSNSNSFKSPLKEINSNVETSTPFMKSELARNLIKYQFIKNFPKDISILESQMSKMTINYNLGDDTMPEIKLFIFKKDQNLSEPVYKFTAPKTISPKTIERYKNLFEETPRMKRKRLRM